MNKAECPLSDGVCLMLKGMVYTVNKCGRHFMTTEDLEDSVDSHVRENSQCFAIYPLRDCQQYNSGLINLGRHRQTSTRIINIIIILHTCICS